MQEQKLQIEPESESETELHPTETPEYLRKFFYREIEGHDLGHVLSRLAHFLYISNRVIVADEHGLRFSQACRLSRRTLEFMSLDKRIARKESPIGKFTK